MENKELLPSQIGCIDLEWLDGEIKYYKNRGYQSEVKSLQLVKNKIFPVTPLLSDAWSKGSIHRDYLNKGSKWDGLKPIDKNDYIVSPIKINKDE